MSANDRFHDNFRLFGTRLLGQPNVDIQGEVVYSPPLPYLHGIVLSDYPASAVREVRS